MLGIGPQTHYPYVRAKPVRAPTLELTGFVESFRFAEKDPTMAKKRVYPAEFRAKIVELIRSGKNANAIAREYEISRQSIINWLKQADLDAGRRTDGMTSAESAENAKLRKRVRELEIERDILKKATAWFARETDSVPGKSSNS